MPYVVTEDCIKCKYTDCVEPCPVDCFHEGENMLVIDQDRCIDCAACETRCPAGAIVPDTDPRSLPWAAMNNSLAKKWPTISVRIPAPPDADDWLGIPDKFNQAFKPNPARRDRPSGGDITAVT